MPMPRRECHDDYPTLAETGTPVYPGPPNKLTPAALERAKAMLLAGKPSRAVAIEIGYVSEITFIPAFKRLTGTTPGAWRKAEGAVCTSKRGGFCKRKSRKPVDRTDQKPLPRRKRA